MSKMYTDFVEPGILDVRVRVECDDGTVTETEARRHAEGLAGEWYGTIWELSSWGYAFYDLGGHDYDGYFEFHGRRREVGESQIVRTLDRDTDEACVAWR